MVVAFSLCLSMAHGKREVTPDVSTPSLDVIALPPAYLSSHVALRFEIFFDTAFQGEDAANAKGTLK